MIKYDADDAASIRSLATDVDGVSDSPYTSDYLATDEQQKVDRGFPSIDESMQMLCDVTNAVNCIHWKVGDKSETERLKNISEMFDEFFNSKINIQNRHRVRFQRKDTPAYDQEFLDFLPQKGVKFYYSTRLNRVTDMDVSDDVTCITFCSKLEHLYTVPHTTKKTVNGVNYSLAITKKQFPQVTKIIIEDDIEEIEISNFMFPNVREVESHHKNYLSGNCLRRISTSWAKSKVYLVNAFCLRKDEVIDLDNVDVIANYAFTGCEGAKIINADKVSEVAENAFSGSNYASGECKEPLVIGSVLIQVPSCDVVDIPQWIGSVCRIADFKKAKKVIVHNTKAMFEIDKALNTTLETIRLEGDSDDDICKLFSNVLGNVENIEISDENSIIKSIDGIVYSKDGKILLACPREKSGEVIIPEGVCEIDDMAFTCSSIESVKFPDSLIDVGNYAFISCVNLKSVDFGRGLSRINDGSKCFDNCWSIKTLHIPGQLKYIGDDGLGALELESVVLEDGVEYIGNSVFFDKDTSDSKLNNISLPNSLRFIGKYNLYGSDKVYLNGNCPKGLVSAMLRPYDYKKDGRQEIRIIDGKNVYYLPAVMSKESLEMLDKVMNIRYHDDAFMQSLFKYAYKEEDKQDVAVIAFLNHQNHKYAADYLCESFSDVCLRYIDKGKSAILANVINHMVSERLTDKIDNTDLKKILKSAQVHNEMQITTILLKEIRYDEKDLKL